MTVKTTQYTEFLRDDVRASSYDEHFAFRRSVGSRVFKQVENAVRIGELSHNDYEQITRATREGNNRVLVELQDGSSLYILHKTVVARRSPPADINSRENFKTKYDVTLRDGGWPTPTTQDAMNQALRRWYLSKYVDVCRKKRNLFLLNFFQAYKVYNEVGNYVEINRPYLHVNVYLQSSS